MPLEVQTAAGGVDFDGTADNGLFSWTKLQRVPSTTRVVLASVALRVAADPGGAPVPLTLSEILFVPPGGAPDNVRELVDRSQGTELTWPLDRSADLVLPCDLTVPRTPNGEFWELRFYTTGKLGPGWAIVDWVARPLPNVSPEDGATP